MVGMDKKFKQTYLTIKLIIFSDLEHFSRSSRIKIIFKNFSL